MRVRRTIFWPVLLLIIATMHLGTMRQVGANAGGMEVAIVGFAGGTPQEQIQGERLAGQLYALLSECWAWTPLHRTEMESRLGRAGLSRSAVIADPQKSVEVDVDLVLTGRIGDGGLQYVAHAPRANRVFEGFLEWRGVSATADRLKDELASRILPRATVTSRSRDEVHLEVREGIGFRRGQTVWVVRPYRELVRGRLADLFAEDRVIIGRVEIVEVNAERIRGRVVREEQRIARGDEVGMIPGAYELGGLEIVSEPRGAGVYIEGEYVGRTPLFLREVPVRELDVRLERDGYREREDRITLLAGLVSDFTFRLDPHPAAVRVESNRAAEVYFNETRMGTVPWEGEVAPGSYRISVRAPGFDPEETTLYLEPDRDYHLRLPLTGPDGSLRVDSMPPEARVFLDRKEKGRTPVELGALTPGYYQLRIEKDRFSPHDRRVLITSGEEKIVEVELEPAPGVFFVESRPAGAEVYRGGSLLGRTPVEFELPPGEHELRVVRDGYATERITVRSVTAVREEKFVDLERLYGQLVLNSDPEGADVYVDGQHLGRTPLEITHPAGSHRFILEKDGLQAQISGRVHPDERNTFFAELTRPPIKRPLEGRAMLLYSTGFEMWGVGLGVEGGGRHRVAGQLAYLATGGAGGYGASYSRFGLGYRFLIADGLGVFVRAERESATTGLNDDAGNALAGGVALEAGDGMFAGRVGPYLYTDDGGWGLYWAAEGSFAVSGGLGAVIAAEGRPRSGIDLSLGLSYRF